MLYRFSIVFLIGALFGGMFFREYAGRVGTGYSF